MGGVKEKEGDGKKAGVVHKCNDCDKCCLRETGRSVETRVKEHCAHARNGRPELSPVAEHALSMMGHQIEWKPRIGERVEKTTARAMIGL